MLDNTTKQKIDTLRDILVGKVSDPKSQVEQITIALFYKFMWDMDNVVVELGGKPTHFSDDYAQYSWDKLFDPSLGGEAVLALYKEAVEKMENNPHIPDAFRDIFRRAYLPYNDPSTLRMFLKLVNDGFHYSHSEMLGDAFEYLLSILGTQGDAGQFRTPRHIIDFITECVNPQKWDVICDPACGTAGFVISAYKHILKQNTDKKVGDKLSPSDRKKLGNNLIGLDIDPMMVKLALANMYLHGFQDPHIYEYDSLTNEDRWNDIYDVVLANPPFMTPKGGIRPHKRFTTQANKAEVLFVDLIATHLSANGRAGIVVPNGIVATTQNAYKNLRKIIIEDSLIAVISLPAGVFNPYSGVKTSILILDKKVHKKTDNILFVKVENDGYDLGAQRRPIDKNDLPNVLASLNEYKMALLNGNEFDAESQEIDCLVVEKKEILKNTDVILSGDRYREVKRSDIDYNWVELESICEVFSDGDWIERKDQSEDGIRLIQTGNVGIGAYKDKKDKAKYISEDTFVRLNCTEIFTNDILISRLPEPVGRACLIPRLDNKLITAVDCTIIRLKKDVMLPSLFVAYTRTSPYYNEISKYITGASRMRISRKNLGKIQIPLPPLEVQEQIVAEIEGYQKIIDGARMVVDNYKPTISINHHWEMVELGSVFQLSSGKFLPKKNIIEGEFNVYGGNGINANHNDYFIDESTVVIGRVGEYCGATHLTTKKCWVTDNGLYVKKFLTHIDKVYLVTILNAINLNQYAKVSGQPSLSQGTIYDIKIPLPSLAKQKEIVTQIEQEQEIVNANKQLITLYEQKIQKRIAQVWGEK